MLASTPAGRPSWLIATSASSRIKFHRHTRTGRPLGSDDFITRAEARLDRIRRPQEPRPYKPGSRDTDTGDVLAGFGKNELPILSP